MMILYSQTRIKEIIANFKNLNFKSLIHNIKIQSLKYLRLTNTKRENKRLRYMMTSRLLQIYTCITLLQGVPDFLPKVCSDDKVSNGLQCIKKKSTIVEIASFLLMNLFLLYKNILISQILKYFSIYKRYVYPPRLFAVKKQENCPKRYSGHDRNMIIKVNIQLCMDIQQHHLIIIFI